MKNRMMFRNLAFSLLVLLAAGCEKNEEDSPQKKLSDCIKGKWYAASINASGVENLGQYELWEEFEFIPKNDAEGTVRATFIYETGEIQTEAVRYTVQADGSGITIQDWDGIHLESTCSGDKLTLFNPGDHNDPVTTTLQRTEFEHPRYKIAKCLKGQWNIVSYKNNGFELLGPLYSSLSMNFDGLATGISTWAYTSDSGSGNNAINYTMNYAATQLLLEYNGQTTSLDFTCTATELIMSGPDIDGSFLNIRATR